MRQPTGPVRSDRAYTPPPAAAPHSIAARHGATGVILLVVRPDTYAAVMLEFLGLSLNIWPWAWLVMAVTLIVVELTVLSGSLIVLPFGVSAFFSALLAFAGVSTGIQWGVFLVGGAVLFLVFWRYQSLVQKGNVLPPGVGAVRLVGMTGVVVRRIDPHDPELSGKVLIEGDMWGAFTEQPVVLPEGARVRIVDVEGTRVKVEPIEEPAGTPQEDRHGGTS